VVVPGLIVIEAGGDFNANWSAGALEVVASEDLSLISAENLRDFDVLYFFTSGELALSDQQKADLLSFVGEGKGFGGVHSATDTLYTWPEYGDLIGAYFNGHPWAQEVSIRVEDPDHPTMRGLGSSFRISDEIYQFRDFSRDRIHVLMSLDTSSVDLTKPGVAREDGDFPLAWAKSYGKGRVFYSSLGHASATWGVTVEQILIRANLGAVFIQLARLAGPVRWARPAEPLT
jgi:hypothetical protein